MKSDKFRLLLSSFREEEKKISVQYISRYLSAYNWGGCFCFLMVATKAKLRTIKVAPVLIVVWIMGAFSLQKQ